MRVGSPKKGSSQEVDSIQRYGASDMAARRGRAASGRGRGKSNAAESRSSSGIKMFQKRLARIILDNILIHMEETSRVREDMPAAFHKTVLSGKGAVRQHLAEAGERGFRGGTTALVAVVESGLPFSELETLQEQLDGLPCDGRDEIHRFWSCC